MPQSSLLTSPFGAPDIIAIFSDETYVGLMLDVESALARAESEVGVIPQDAADQIASGIQSLTVDYQRLRAGMEKDGVPVSALVQQIREHIEDTSAGFVHFGATTQDIMDTALVLQIRSAFNVIEKELGQAIENLASLANRHRFTVMAGRTHSQQAVPICFGLKAAGWLSPLLRHRDRLAELSPRVLVVQFGGAAGTGAVLNTEIGMLSTRLGLIEISASR